MAQSTLTLTNHDASTRAVTLVSLTPKGALYRLTSRNLSVPFTLEYQFNLAPVGSKGNDKLSIFIHDTCQNGTTGVVSTGSIRVDVSVPRDTTWTETMTLDLLANIGNALSVSGLRTATADATVY